MTISDPQDVDEPEILVQERLAELEKANRELSRRNLVLEGINRIFSIVVQDTTEEELGNECLSVALEVTGSQLGFVNLLGDDGLLHDIAISDIGCKQCLMYDKTGHRSPQGNFVVHGLYGNVINSEKSFFTNDPMSHPYSIGIPCGHPQLTSFLGVPLMLDGKIMGMLGVANREAGYNSEQQADIEAVTPAIVQAIQRKRSENKRVCAEEALRFSDEKFAKAFADNPAAITLTNLEDGLFLDVNDTWLALTGYSRDEVIGHSARTMHIWPNAEAAERFVLELWEKGYLYGWEQEFYKKSGDVYIAKLSAKILAVHGEKRIISTVVDITEQKQAEEERERLLSSTLHEKALLSTLLNSINDEIWFADSQENFTLVNPSGRREFGISDDEKIKVEKFISNLDIYRPDGSLRPIEDDPALRALRGEVITGYEHIVRIPATGELCHRQINSSPVRDPEGNIIGSISVVRDITKSKQGEKELKESEKRLQAIIDGSDNAFYVKDQDGHFILINKHLEKLLGMKRDEVIGKTDYDIFTPELADCYKMNDSKILGTGVPEQLEEVSYLVDGWHTFIANKFPLYDSQDKPYAICGISTDITERKKIESALCESEERFRNLANAIPQLAWIAQPDGYIYWYNERWYSYTGTTPEQMEGWGWQSVHDPEMLPKVLERWKASIATGQMFDMEFPLRGADGVFRPFLTRVLPFNRCCRKYPSVVWDKYRYYRP